MGAHFWLDHGLSLHARDDGRLCPISLYLDLNLTIHLLIILRGQDFELRLVTTLGGIYPNFEHVVVRLSHGRVHLYCVYCGAIQMEHTLWLEVGRWGTGKLRIY